MSKWDRFQVPPDYPEPPCCLECDLELCPTCCDKLESLIEANNKIILDLEIKMSWPSKEK